MSRKSDDQVSHPDPDRGNIDGGLVHVVAFVVAGGDGAELLELAEAEREPLRLVRDELGFRTGVD